MNKNNASESDTVDKCIRPTIVQATQARVAEALAQTAGQLYLPTG